MISTRLLTHHVVSNPNAPVRIEMMLDEYGRGTLTLLTEQGPLATFDADTADGIPELFTAALSLRDDLRLRGDELVAGTA